MAKEPGKLKIALLFVCINPPYWPYLRQIISDCDQYFFRNKRDNVEVDYLAWTDLPEGTTYGATVYPLEPMEWPMPTLMRYHFFLQEEEKLKDYDYIFYLDADMKMVAPVGREILGEGLTAAPHPGYYLKNVLIPPYEPNPQSEAYIKLPGHITEKDGKKSFQPFYAAGGFQGGRAADFIKAMKAMKAGIDKDFNKNYIARWNDESHWNKYLLNNPPTVYLTPSYVYPDSLINEHYIPLWGQNFEPKIITLTKPFSLQKLTPKDRAAIGLPMGEPFTCPTCGDTVIWEGVTIKSVRACNGKGQPHEVEGMKT